MVAALESGDGNCLVNAVDISWGVEQAKSAQSGSETCGTASPAPLRMIFYAPSRASNLLK